MGTAFVWLIAGMGLLLAGASVLTDGSAALARRFRISEMMVGLTVIAVGTSAPELIVSLLSSLDGSTEIAIGNVVGSNLFNTLLILGVVALIVPVKLDAAAVRRDIPILLSVSLLLVVLTSDTFFGWSPVDRLSRWDGAILLAGFLLFMVYTVRTALGYRRDHPEESRHEPGRKQQRIWVLLLMIGGGLAGLIFGGDLFLENGQRIARTLGVNESVIAITLMAGGTSLPELAASAVAAVKGKSQLALGNIIGSNIFNILLVLGVSAVASPLTLGSITLVDLGMVLFSALLLFITAFTFGRHTLSRIEGAFFILIYAGYIGWVIVSK